MAWTEDDQIVHQLRSQGWSREDAHEEADKRTARMIERREIDEAMDAFVDLGPCDDDLGEGDQ